LSGKIAIKLEVCVLLTQAQILGVKTVNLLNILTCGCVNQQALRSHQAFAKGTCSYPREKSTLEFSWTSYFSWTRFFF